uniref:NADH-ubiquinone oxidoreductase chain 1 n=1 Tax=Ammothea hilgendorfi TaxID=258330 RepID=E0XLG5_AMMHI|nr:NADH dehydrogenase subunit 1 [Ammothea hilgendorfi]
MKFLDLLLNYLLLVLLVLVGVGFFTLLERKILSYIGNRKGPNKVMFWGLGQPLADGLKLFGKEYVYTFKSIYVVFMLCPVLMIILSLMMWMCTPMMGHFIDLKFGLLYFLVITGMSVYALIFSGWSSNSKYSIFGGYRGVAQTISYEVSLSLVMLSFVFMVGSYDLAFFSVYQLNSWMIIFMLPLSMIWFVSMLAETNRTPFDFSEGESELVSGFNIEYGGVLFAFIFIGEYSSIIFMSVLYVILFLGGLDLLYMYKIMVVIILFILIRGSLPRFRYDNLMYMAWKIYLPMSIHFLFFFFGIKMFLYVYML